MELYDLLIGAGCGAALAIFIHTLWALPRKQVIHLDKPVFLHCSQCGETTEYPRQFWKTLAEKSRHEWQVRRIPDSSSSTGTIRKQYFLEACPLCGQVSMQELRGKALDTGERRELGTKVLRRLLLMLLALIVAGAGVFLRMRAI